MLHCATVPWWLLVFTSDNFSKFTPVQREWWWYCSYWTCEHFFSHTRILTWDLWISSHALYHCVIVTSGFPSDNFSNLNLVQRDWWWYFSDWICERFSFCPHWNLKWVPLDVLPCTLPLCHGDFRFYLWQFQVFNSAAEGLVVVLFWLDLWEIFFFLHTRIWNGVHWICSLALYHCTSMTSGLHLWIISGIQLWCRGIGGGIVLIGLVRDILFACTRIWTWNPWISSPALNYCTTVTIGFYF